VDLLYQPIKAAVPILNKGRSVTQEIEHLHSKCMVLSSDPSTAKDKKKKKRKEEFQTEEKQKQINKLLKAR
jgi:galactose-1-phosphate uridylyltransferase